MRAVSAGSSHHPSAAARSSAAAGAAACSGEGCADPHAAADAEGDQRSASTQAEVTAGHRSRCERRRSAGMISCEQNGGR